MEGSDSTWYQLQKLCGCVIHTELLFLVVKMSKNIRTPSAAANPMTFKEERLDFR